MISLKFILIFLFEIVLVRTAISFQARNSPKGYAIRESGPGWTLTFDCATATATSVFDTCSPTETCFSSKLALTGYNFSIPSLASIINVTALIDRGTISPSICSNDNIYVDLFDYPLEFESESSTFSSNTQNIIWNITRNNYYLST